jgi:hypothetical protein
MSYRDGSETGVRKHRADELRGLDALQQEAACAGAGSRRTRIRRVEGGQHDHARVCQLGVGHNPRGRLQPVHSVVGFIAPPPLRVASPVTREGQRPWLRGTAAANGRGDAATSWFVSIDLA